MDISKLLSELRQWLVSPSLLCFVALFCGAVLFFPDGFANAVGYSAVRNDYRIWFGAFFLGASVGLLIHLGAWVYRRCHAWHVRRKKIQSLARFSNDEKAVLRRFIICDTATQYFELGNAVPRGLVMQGILYQSSNIAEVGIGLPFNIQPYIRDAIKENPLLVGRPHDWDTDRQEIESDGRAIQRGQFKGGGSALLQSSRRVRGSCSCV